MAKKKDIKKRANNVISQKKSFRDSGTAPKPGRPSLLKPKIAELIISLVRAGNYIEVAVGAAGISKETFYSWGRQAKEDQYRGYRTKYTQFLDAIEQASAEATARDMALIAEAAERDWRAAAWRLERRLPKVYGKQLQLAGPENQPINFGGAFDTQKLEQALMEDPDLAERIKDLFRKSAYSGNSDFSVGAGVETMHITADEALEEISE